MPMTAGFKHPSAGCWRASTYRRQRRRPVSWQAFRGGVPILLIIYVAAVSGFCFLAFAWDKYCAMRGLWRIPEKTLLMLAAIGGTPGAFAGQRVLRHKTQKQPFGTYLLLIAIAQAIGILALIVLSGGSAAALLLI